MNKKGSVSCLLTFKENKMNIEEYAKKHKHILLDQIPDELDFIIRNNSFKKIIDVGCGGGLFLYSLFKRNYEEKFEEIWGIDLSEKRLESVQEISEKIKTVKADAQVLENVPDDNFDLVVSTQVIEHVSDDKDMLDALYRVSKKRAVIYLDTVYKKKWAWYFYKNDRGMNVLDPTHVREYTDEKELLDKIDKNKFIVLNSTMQNVKYSIVNFIIKKLRIKSENSRLVSILRYLKIPVPGYYIWKITMVKI